MSLESQQHLFIIVILSALGFCIYMGTVVFPEDLRTYHAKYYNAKNKYYEKCLLDHKEYECDALWASARKLVN